MDTTTYAMPSRTTAVATKDIPLTAFVAGELGEAIKRLREFRSRLYDEHSKHFGSPELPPSAAADPVQPATTEAAIREQCYELRGFIGDIELIGSRFLSRI